MKKALLVMLSCIALTASCSKEQHEVNPPSSFNDNFVTQFRVVAKVIDGRVVNNNSIVSSNTCIDTCGLKSDVFQIMENEVNLESRSQYRNFIAAVLSSHNPPIISPNNDIVITGASITGNEYVNQIVSSTKSVVDSYAESIELSQSDYTSKDLQDMIIENVNNIENSILADGRLTADEKQQLVASTSAAKILMPTIIATAEKVAQCDEPGIGQRGLGRFLRRVVNVIATLVAYIVPSVFEFGIYGAAAGAFIGGAPGAGIGATWGGLAGGLLGFGNAVIAIVQGNCVWGPC